MNREDKTALKKVVIKTLRENGLSDEPAAYDSSIHSWRCEHPDRYGACDCLKEFAKDIVLAVVEWMEGRS